MSFKKYPKYYIYLCLYDKWCNFKTQDRKTGLPICRVAGVGSKPSWSCSQQFQTTQQKITTNKLTIQNCRRIKFKNAYT